MGQFTWREAGRLLSGASSAAPEGAGDSPGVGLLVSVVERFQLLQPLLAAETRRVAHSVERRSKLHQPAGVDDGHLPHVLLGGQHQLVVNKPAGTTTTTRTISFIYSS